MVGRFFSPDVDIDQYDDEIAQVLRCIVQAVDGLYDELLSPPN